MSKQDQRTYQSGLLFIQAHKLIRTRVYDVLEPYELNPSYWLIISTVVHSPDGIRLASVSRIMNVKAPLVTMLSNDLIERDLINRVPHHTDKRAKLLVITPKGKTLYNKLEKELGEEINHLMAGVSDKEAQTFQTVLETIIRNADH